MKLGIRNEAASGEARVSATPASVTSLVELGFEVAVVSGAGALSGLTDQAFEGDLEDLAYPYVDETDNEAYRAFLR